MTTQGLITRVVPPVRLGSRSAVHMLERNLLMIDGEDHRRLRGLVNKAFTPRRVEQLRPRLEANAEAILERIKPLNADVYILAEFFGTKPQQAILRGLGKPFRVLREQHYLTVFARQRVRLVHRQSRISKRAYFVQWESPAGPMLLLLIDFKSQPLFYRAPILDVVRERVVELRPDLIVGDFTQTNGGSSTGGGLIGAGSDGGGAAGGASLPRHSRRLRSTSSADVAPGR